MRWGRAFVYALKSVLVAAAFLLAGTLLIVLGFTTLDSGGFLLVLVGYVVSLVGWLAALYKYLPEAVAEELKQCSPSNRCRDG